MTTPALPRFILYPPGWDEAETDVTAYLDWATGSVQWFIAASEFEDLMAAARGRVEDFGDWHGDLIEIWAHELEHLLQIAVTGFAYDLSRRMYEIVSEAATRYGSLSLIYRHREEYTERLGRVLEAVNRSSPDGVTAQQLLEGLAFLRQKLLFTPGITHAAFVAALDAEVKYASYRNAYDVATGYLGEDAILHFAHVANIALYTRRPEVVFVPLLERFAASASRLGREANHQLGTDLLGNRFPTLILGTAVSQVSAGHHHPAVSPTVSRIQAWVRAGAKENRFFTLQSGHAPYDLTLLARNTMYFPPNEDGTTPMISGPEDEAIEADGKRTSYFRYLCAVSRILQHDLPELEASPAMTRPKLPPDAPPDAQPDVPPDAQPDVPLSVKLLYFSHEDVTQPEKIDEWASSLTAVSSDRSMARAFRGTCFWSFGDIDGDWNPEFTDPQVGAFVRGLFERVPHLLYFLHEGPNGDAAISVILGAFVPENQVRMPDGVLGFRVESRGMSVLMRLFRDAADFAERMGDARSAVLTHLESLPAQAAQPIRDAVAG